MYILTTLLPIVCIFIKATYATNCKSPWLYPYNRRYIKITKMEYGPGQRGIPGISDGGYLTFACNDPTKGLKNDKVFCRNGRMEESGPLLCENTQKATAISSTGKLCGSPWSYSYDRNELRVFRVKYGPKIPGNPGMGEGGYIQLECKDRSIVLENDKVYCRDGQFEESGPLSCKKKSKDHQSIKKPCKSFSTLPYDAREVQIIKLEYGVKIPGTPGIGDGGYIQFTCKNPLATLEKNKVYCRDGQFEESGPLSCKTKSEDHQSSEKSCGPPSSYHYDVKEVKIIKLEYGVKMPGNSAISDGGYIQFACHDSSKELENDKVYCTNKKWEKKEPLICKVKATTAANIKIRKLQKRTCENPWTYPYDEKTIRIRKLNYGDKERGNHGLGNGGYIEYECINSTKVLLSDKVFCKNGFMKESAPLLCVNRDKYDIVAPSKKPHKCSSSFHHSISAET
ncbi:hypothetical protein SNEBB_005179 [Seison nebaliae]|nr:hypothetical protein SNEBB_005179 [Seison nebaliae]